MSEPKPRVIPCNDCDHLCESTEDGECAGRLNKDERKAVYERIAWVWLNNAQSVRPNIEAVNSLSNSILE